MNWRDERDLHDYEARERAEGHREVAEPRDTSEHAQVAAALRTLPDFTHQPAQRVHVIPAPEPELPEEHDANTASRMSIAQLRDRIRGMEATAAKYAHGFDQLTGRQQKPSEKRAHAAKLKAYRAELATREAREATSEAERQAYNAKLDQQTTQADAKREAPARSAAPLVDPANVPNLVRCNVCRLLVAQDDAGDMIDHLDNAQVECAAKPTWWTRPRTNPRFADQIAQPAKHEQTTEAQPAAEPASRKCNADGCSSQTYDEHGLCSFHRAQYDAAQADPIKAAQAKRDAREAIECPQCHAKPGERCTNYSGSHCAPHGARKPAAQVATVTELPPPPPAAAAQAAAATAKRKATVEAAQAQTLSELDRAVEQLVRQHSSHAVIDAAWSAAHRIFAPGGRA